MDAFLSKSLARTANQMDANGFEITRLRDVTVDGKPLPDKVAQQVADSAYASYISDALKSRGIEGTEGMDLDVLMGAGTSEIMQEADQKFMAWQSVNGVYYKPWARQLESFAISSADDYREGELSGPMQSAIDRYNSMSDMMKVNVVGNMQQKVVLDNYKYFKDAGNTDTEALRKAQRSAFDPTDISDRTKEINDQVSEQFEDAYVPFWSFWETDLDNQATYFKLQAQVRDSVVREMKAGSKMPVKSLVAQKLAVVQSNSTITSDGGIVNATQGVINTALDVHDKKQADRIILHGKASIMRALKGDVDAPSGFEDADAVEVMVNPVTKQIRLKGANGELTGWVPSSYLKNESVKEEAAIEARKKKNKEALNSMKAL